MLQKFNKFLDRVSDFFSSRKGLLPLIGMILVITNFTLHFFPSGWLSQTDLLLHLGIITAIMGFLIAWAL